MKNERIFYPDSDPDSDDDDRPINNINLVFFFTTFTFIGQSTFTKSLHLKFI